MIDACAAISEDESYMVDACAAISEQDAASQNKHLLTDYIKLAKRYGKGYCELQHCHLVAMHLLM